MKKTVLLLVVLATCLFSTFGQAPEGINYQAVVRDASNNILTNQAVGIRMTIQQGSIGGTSIYTETFASTTNAYGLINLIIGSGVTSDNFTTIDWANGPFYMETAIDVTGGANYSVMGTSQLMSVPYALHAKTAESLSNSCELSIGDTFQGGIIFYLDPSGCHGLICAPSDQSTEENWWNDTYIDTRAYGSGAFEGKYNTGMIYAIQGGTGNAIALCVNYTGGGYTDWYLPSIHELNLMNLNIGQLNSLSLGNVGGFGDYGYWSSTEIQIYTAWVQYFSDGFQGDYNKNNSYAVRAIRAF